MNDVIKKTMENLKKNNMAAYYVETKEEVVPLVKQLVPQGSSVSNGGSESLIQSGVFDLLESGYYDFADRRGLEGDAIRECYIKAFGCDAFFCSSNAVTENGELYNVDGNSNRVACIVYGPKKVIMVVGINKIVPDIAAAVERVKKISAPLNTKGFTAKLRVSQRVNVSASQRAAQSFARAAKARSAFAAIMLFRRSKGIRTE